MKAAPLLLLCLLLPPAISLAELPGEIAQLKIEADDIATRYIAKLKPQLVNAINSGGLSHAVNICAVEAPKIATELQEDTGWKVRRVSLKTRNMGNATPDKFEQSVLKQFEEEVSQSAVEPKLTRYEVVNNEFRYLKAQKVDGICLSCHGQSIAADVAQTIEKLYPEDQATGYLPGQVRGAISLSKRLSD